ncbi:MAG: MEDS domain-containing protein [Bacteroidota bacterium]
MRNTDIVPDWTSTKAKVFWGEIAPCEHVVQIYESDEIFLDTLAGFVGGGINAGDCCLVIATDNHIMALEERLTSYGIQVKDLVTENRYFPLSAEQTLSRFMVNGWPDETLFNETISEIISKCAADNRKVRAFGEMVAILWAQGHNGATIQLEHLWNRFCANKSFCLFCAYPKSGFTDDINTSIMHVCGAHSKMISGSRGQLTEISYKELIAV